MKREQKIPRNRHAVAVRTMRKQVIASKKKYNRKEKHKTRVSGSYSYAAYPWTLLNEQYEPHWNAATATGIA